MAFTPEDGTGVAGANSYCTLEYADDYHQLRGNVAWAGADSQNREAALVKATDYIEQQYAGRWTGEPLEADQALSWPRDSVEWLPAALKSATAVLALEALTSDLNPVLEQAIKREKVGPIETEYADGSDARVRRPAIDGLLRGLVVGRPINLKVVRV